MKFLIFRFLYRWQRIFFKHKKLPRGGLFQQQNLPSGKPFGGAGVTVCLLQDFLIYQYSPGVSFSTFPLPAAVFLHQEKPPGLRCKTLFQKQGRLSPSG